MFFNAFKPANRRSNSIADNIQRKSIAVQPKLTVGKPNDKYEQEADRVADRVMSMPASQAASIQSKCADCEGTAQPKLADGITPLVQRMGEEEEPAQAKMIQRMGEEEEPAQAKMIQRMGEEEEPAQAKMVQRMGEEEEPAQAKAAQKAPVRASSRVEAMVQTSRGGGHRLPGATQNFMQSRFGTSFDHVRVHTDARAVQMSRELNAQAFTVGNNVYFNQGKFSPETNGGKHLLAHELTHVVQQKGKK